jgi:hypothetical protein
MIDAHEKDSERTARWEAEKAAAVAKTPAQPSDGKSYEQSVADAWKDAERGNREADKAMDDMIESYRRRSVSSSTSSGVGSRVDTFHMPSGEIVFCRTTVRNGARATTCK